MRMRERLGFSAAGFGQNLVLNFVTLYLLLYLIEGVGLSTAGIAKATAILTGAKVWDAIADLLIGVSIDRTRTRWGRFRPYIVVTAAPIAVLATLLFAIPAASEDAQLVWFGIAYVVFATTYTIADVPYWALTSTIATDEPSRTSLISWARTAGAIALAVVTLGGGPLARLLSFGPTTTTSGWFRAAALVSVIGMGMFTLAFFTTSEKVAPTHDPLPFGASLRAIAANKSLLLLLASGVLGFGRFVLQVGGAVVALIVFGDETLFALLGAALIVAMICATLATPILLRYTSRRSLMIWSSVAAVIVYAAMWFVGYRSLPAALAVIFCSGLLLGIFMVTQTTMIGDTVDDGELRTGQRSDGVCFAGLTFVSKLSGALATVVFGLVVAAVGYTKGTTITPAMQDGVWVATAFVPAISVLISLVPLLWYRVPEADMPELLARARATAPARQDEGS